MSTDIDALIARLRVPRMLGDKPIRPLLDEAAAALAAQQARIAELDAFDHDGALHQRAEITQRARADRLEAELEQMKEWRRRDGDAAVECLTEERIKRERAEAALRQAEADAQRYRKDSERLHWLHSPASCVKDHHNCEWGIWRVSWEGGRASHVWATNSDFSDLDTAMETAQKTMKEIA